MSILLENKIIFQHSNVTESITTLLKSNPPLTRGAFNKPPVFPPSSAKIENSRQTNRVIRELHLNDEKGQFWQFSLYYKRFLMNLILEKCLL